MSTGSRRAGLVAGRQQHRGGQARGRPTRQQRDARDQAGRLGVRRDRGRPTSGALDRRDRRRRRRGPGGRPRSVPPRSLPVCTPSAAVRAREAVRRPTSTARPTPGSSLARSSTRLAVDVQHAPHLQGRRRDRLAADDQPPGARRRRPTVTRRARGGVRGHAGDDVDPDRVGALVVEAWWRRWPGRRAARAAPSGRGAGRRRAGRGRPRRRRRGTPRSQRIGVRRPSQVMISARDQRRSACPPPGRRRPSGSRSGCAGSAMCQRCTGVSSTRATTSASPVGRPPVAAHPLHLLGGDEVGEPVARRAAPSGAASVLGRPAGEVVDVQRAGR